MTWANPEATKPGKLAFQVEDTEWGKSGIFVLLVIASSTFTGSASSGGMTRIDPSNLFGISGVVEYAEIPVRFDVSLSDSPEAQKYRSKGAPVYVYAKQIYTAEQRQVESGKTSIINGRIQLPGDNFCDGYMIVLSPTNNYRISKSFDFKFKIRDQADGMDAGIFGKIGSSNWEISEIITDAFVVDTGRSPFRVKTGSRLYGPCIYPDSKGQWK